ncbi:MAG: purine-binding chemotaxis protein CheW [Magnetococcales bacterium]|nr:purine-binding chemotaxis protein CheW [Magnetococcales bacterium]NGZ27275.1 purine-binding chemotaxis protein CheW [Magnetococcales bacterium]
MHEPSTNHPTILPAGVTQGAFLTFRLIDKYYGIDAHLVREIVRLPEITPMEEAPPFVAGILNLRGHMVPVIDLHLRMGRLSVPYKVGDSVVVLEVQNHLLGIIISEVMEVRTFEKEEMEQTPNLGESEIKYNTHIIHGIAQADDQMIMLLATQLLFNFSDSVTEARNELEGGEGGDEPSHRLAQRRSFHPDCSLEEREILRNRARMLRIVQNERDHLHAASSSEKKLALAVVSLYGELLGVDLAIVMGFAPLRHVTPIPCCPDFVVGDMNLRGEILTLVDLGRVLNMTTSQQEPTGKVLVVGWEGIKIGVPIHEVVDVIHLFADEIAAPPARTGFLDPEHLRGVAPYGQEMLGIVDLKRILSHENLIVNETV